MTPNKSQPYYVKIFLPNPIHTPIHFQFINSDCNIGSLGRFFNGCSILHTKIFCPIIKCKHFQEGDLYEFDTKKKNPLGYEKLPRLLKSFAVPSIIAMLVSAVYNIADQLFIGNAVGTLGNAATNIAFPLSMLCTSLALLFGIGGAASFNLHMGAGRKEEAPYYIGNSITMLLSLGFLLLAYSPNCF